MDSSPRESLEALAAQIAAVERELGKLRECVTTVLNQMAEPPQGSPRGQGSGTRTGNLPSDEELQEAFAQLADQYKDKRDTAVVDEFVSQHSTRFLEKFARANHLPFSTKKMNKQTVATTLGRLMRETIAMTNPVKRLILGRRHQTRLAPSVSSCRWGSR